MAECVEVWKTKLRRATWRGVPFYIEEARGAVGRRIEHHEFPQRDDPWAEDLGRARRTWELTGYALGSTYMAIRDRMIAACQQKGTGTLIHPYFGQMQVVCNAMRFSERDAEGGICRFEFVFCEPGSVAPIGIRAMGAALGIAGSGLAAAAKFVFSMFSFKVAGWPDFVADDARLHLVELARLLDTLRGPTLEVPAALAQATQAHILALLALDPATASAAAIADTVTGAIVAFADSAPPARALDGLERLSQTVFTVPMRPTAIPILLPAGFASRAAIPPAHWNHDYWNIGAWTWGHFLPPTLPIPLTAARAQLVENARCLTALVQQSAAAALPTPVSNYPLTVYEDFVAVRDRVIAICDRCLPLAADPVILELARLRDRIVTQLAARGATLVHLVRYIQAFTRPSLTLAQRFYQDASRADELVMRTGAVHPGFLPTSGLVAGA